MEAGIIIIGTEVLSGETLDTNAQFMGKELNRIGYNIIEKITIPDAKEAIFNALDNIQKLADVIIISGGLGPTNDDITKNTLTEYFKTKLEYREEVHNNIKELLKGRFSQFPERLRAQAMIPENAIHLKNQWGTASGIWFNEYNKVFVSLPGVPNEMQGVLVHEVLPRLKELNPDSVLISRNVKTIGIAESIIADRIKDIEDNLPSYISMAYLPRFGQVKIRLTGQSKERLKLKNELNNIIIQIQERVSSHAYGVDEESIEEVIGKLLIKKGARIATAESCTGGYIAHLITSVPGSSQYFQGSIIAYSNDVKIEQLSIDESILDTYGAVSKECVEAMAIGVQKQLKTDYAIATSGIAGPAGATPEKPVGSVWMAVAGNGKVESRLYNFLRGREQNIMFSSFRALAMMWEMLM